MSFVAGAKKRLESFAIAEETPVYDVVNEQEYADIVAKRREAGGAFVEGEDTLGYDDMGEDNWDVAEDEYEDQADGSKKRGRKEAPDGGPADKKKAQPAKAKSALAMAAAARGGHSLQSMWAKGGMPGAGAAKPKNPKVLCCCIDFLFEKVNLFFIPVVHMRIKASALP
jgi:hypothetical protein